VARRSVIGPAGLSGEDIVALNTLALQQVAVVPAWVGPTMAISLVVIALSILAAAAALAVAAMRLSSQVEKLSAMVNGLQDDVVQTLKAVRRLTEQAQDVMVLVRHEAGAFAQTSRRVRRKLSRGVDRIEGKLADLETLYDVVHGEVEDAALEVASTLRSIRRGNGMLGRVRRLVAGRT
jgi:ABC-type transporter Mla subunit MlaD